MAGMPIQVDRVNRHAERARHARDDLYAVLDAGHHLGTLSTVVDGRPWVVPMLYGRAGDRLLLHGSAGAGALRQPGHADETARDLAFAAIAVHLGEECRVADAARIGVDGRAAPGFACGIVQFQLIGDRAGPQGRMA